MSPSRRSASRSQGRRAAAIDVQQLHLDCFSGASGNMFLGALLDLGVPRKRLTEDLAGLGVPHRIRVQQVQRGALSARYVTVSDGRGRKATAKRDRAHRTGKARKAGRRAKHTHGPGHTHDHDHDHAHAHAASGHADAHPHAHGRSHAEIVRLIRRGGLATPVRDRALAIFDALGEAEAHVHGVALADVHFHEVGAVDAIVDIVGTASLLHHLGVERITASPVGLGSGGTVETAHGRLPNPAPATLELLRGIPTVPAGVTWETVTPTGAAILRSVVDAFEPMAAGVPERSGWGAGDDRVGPGPNVLRATLLRTGGYGRDRVVGLETNLDDLSPEHFDHLMERLLEAGALDVTLLHQQMKKNRPGFLVRVLARPADRLALAGILFAESTAIGVRMQEYDRLLLERETLRVDTPYGRIGVKRVTHPDGRVDVSAEYDDCKRAARRADVPLRDVARAAEAAARG